jgi:hypothetical protein
MTATIAAHIAASRGEAIEYFSDQTTQTAIDFFRGLR